MDDKKSTDSERSEIFEDQIAGVPAESTDSKSDFQPLQPVEYPRKKPLKHDDSCHTLTNNEETILMNKT